MSFLAFSSGSFFLVWFGFGLFFLGRGGSCEVYLTSTGTTSIFFCNVYCLYGIDGVLLAEL